MAQGSCGSLVVSLDGYILGIHTAGPRAPYHDVNGQTIDPRALVEQANITSPKEYYTLRREGRGIDGLERAIAFPAIMRDLGKWGLT